MEPALRCLIVDDEAPAHLVLKSHIGNCPGLLFAASAYNGKEALQCISEQRIDIVFLDIDMPVLDGHKVMQKLGGNPVVIITTAYANFAFEAFQNHAADYLLKPVTLQRFMKAVEKARFFLKSGEVQEPVNGTLTVRIAGEQQEIPLSSILYTQSVGNYVKIFLIDETSPVVAYDSLKNILDRAPSSWFVQTHKSFLVSIRCIKQISRDNLELEGGIKVPVGRKYELVLNKLRK